MLYPVDANFSRRRLLWDLLKQTPRVGDAPLGLLRLLFRHPWVCGVVSLAWVGLGLWLSPLLLQMLFFLAVFVSAGILGGRWGGWACLGMGLVLALT